MGSDGFICSNGVLDLIGIFLTSNLSFSMSSCNSLNMFGSRNSNPDSLSTFLGLAGVKMGLGCVGLRLGKFCLSFGCVFVVVA